MDNTVEFSYMNRPYEGAPYRAESQARSYLYILVGYDIMESSVVCGDTITLEGVQIASICWDDELEIPIFTFSSYFGKAVEATKRQKQLVSMLKNKP